MAADYDKTRDKMPDDELGLKGAQVFRKPRDMAQPRTPLFLQRLARNSASTRAEASELENGTSAAMNDGQSSERRGGAGLVVEDSASRVLAGQMRKSEFLERLREAVTAEAAEALMGTVWSSAGCPWIEHWFDYYATGGRGTNRASHAEVCAGHRWSGDG